MDIFTTLCYLTFEDYFLITFSFPFFSPPSHLDITLLSMAFDKTGYSETPFGLQFFFIFPHQQTKIISTFIQSKIFNET